MKPDSRELSARSVPRALAAPPTRHLSAFDRHHTMPLTPEEPQISESVPGPRSAAGSASTSQVASSAAVPGPRSASRPAPHSAEGRQGAEPRRTGGRQGGRSAGKPASTAADRQKAAQIDLREATEATAVEVADEVVDSLLDEGRSPDDVLVLTTGESHPWTQHELSFGEDAYWRQQTESEDVFFAEASATEHLRSRGVVVLAVNGGSDAQAAAALPAALGKAHDTLIVCGDPQRLRALL